MAEFPYSPHAAKIKLFFDHIQKAGVPEKVTLKYLEQVGFKSKNDRYLLPILKFLGFVDEGGKPTPVWNGYRDRQTARTILAHAIRKSYADLFKTYPDADRKDSEALQNYFSAKTNVADTTNSLIVATFRALVASADFDVPGGGSHDESRNAPPTLAVSLEERKSLDGAGVGYQRGGCPTININIQLQLPATEDASIYEKLFAALRKHLISDSGK